MEGFLGVGAVSQGAPRENQTFSLNKRAQSNQTLHAGAEAAASDEPSGFSGLF